MEGSPRRGRWTGRLAGVLTAVVAGVLLCIPAAMAHAALVSTDPAGGSVLAGPPTQMMLHFNEPVAPLVFSVLSPDGQPSELTGVTTMGPMVMVPLPRGMSKGTHLLSWRVISEDGHPIAGTVAFSIGAAGANALAPPQTGDLILSVAIWLVRAALYVCLFLGVGGAVFNLVVAPALVMKRLGLALVTLGLALVLIATPLQGLDALGRLASELFQREAIGAGLATTYGRTLAFFALAFAATGLSYAVTGRARKVTVIAAWALASIAPTLSGHAASASPVWLTRSAIALHVASLLFWIGALIPLGVLLRHSTIDAARALQRFSRWIPWAVVPILVSGLTLAVVQMGWPGPEWFTPYAAVLAAKLALVAGLLALALWNRLALTKGALAGRQDGRLSLRRSIVIEVALAIAIFGLVAGWRLTPPPRSLAAIERSAEVIHLHNDSDTAEITILPGDAGAVQLTLSLTGKDGGQLSAQSVTVTVRQDTAGVEGLKSDARLLEGGTWRVDDLVLPAIGHWAITLEARVGDYELVRFEREVLAPQRP